MTEDKRFRTFCSGDIVYSPNLMEYVEGKKFMVDII
jgi:hypothetical protein